MEISYLPKAPRGMQNAKVKAREIYYNGGSVKNCPYISKSWRSAFCKEMENLQQMPLGTESRFLIIGDNNGN